MVISLESTAAIVVFSKSNNSTFKNLIYSPSKISASFNWRPTYYMNPVLNSTNSLCPLFTCDMEVKYCNENAYP
jgi:hypothetical protein